MIEYNNTIYRTTSTFIYDALHNGEDYEYILNKLNDIGINRDRGLVMINYVEEEL